jgi:hypothetical protein
VEPTNPGNYNKTLLLGMSLTAKQSKNGGVEPPISLGGLFFNPDDSDNEQETSVQADQQFLTDAENQMLKIGRLSLNIRQFSWHQANANQVWPGTFVLANFIEDRKDRYNDCVLELGSATGALAIYLRLIGFTKVFTRYSLMNYDFIFKLFFVFLLYALFSDIDDGGEVVSNIAFNETQNGEMLLHCYKCTVNHDVLLRGKLIVCVLGLSNGVHVPHTWGTGWETSVSALSPDTQSSIKSSPFKYIIASDILLYVR